MPGKIPTQLAILAAGAFLVATQVFAQSQTRTDPGIRTPAAEQVLNAAFETARAEQKVVLTHFGASWCTWCLHLDAMLTSDEVGSLFQDNYVITHLTVQESDDKVALENPGAQEILDAAGAGDSGLPAYIIFDSDGKQLATSLVMPGGGNIGHPVTPDEIVAFLVLLDQTAPRMTAADRDRVSAYLTNQNL